MKMARQAVDSPVIVIHTLSMTLSELLEPDLILTKAVCSSKDELINKLVERIYSSDNELPILKNELLKTIYLRELIGGTLLPSGLSVPHARLKNYEGFIIAMGIPAEPLFHEGVQIYLSAMMITNQSGTPLYLPSLAALTKMSKNKEYFTRLYGVNTPEEFITIIRERDTELT